MVTQKLYIDRKNAALVASQSSSMAASASFYQGNTVTLQVFVLLPTGSPVGASFTVEDLSDYDLRMSIGPAPTGSSSTKDITVSTFAWDEASKSYSAEFDLAAAWVAAALGANRSVDRVIEFSLADIDNNLTTILQTACTIKAVLDK